jgi:hypothetical protein
MNDATAYLYGRVIGVLFCAASFCLLRRFGWWRGTLLSVHGSLVLGFLSIWFIGSGARAWNLSAAIYRSLWLAHGCAQACFGVLWLEQVRQNRVMERKAEAP